MTPAQKLDRSRLAIVESMAGSERRNAGASSRAGPDDSDGRTDTAQDEGADGSFSRSGWLRGVSSAARAWWYHHPAHTAVDMATPALRSQLRKRPFQVLALSAGVGALLAVTRPWRLVSLTTLVVAIVKSSQLSGVVMSALSDAQGWHEQQRGREPPE